MPHGKILLTLATKTLSWCRMSNSCLFITMNICFGPQHIRKITMIVISIFITCKNQMNIVIVQLLCHVEERLFQPKAAYTKEMKKCYSSYCWKCHYLFHIHLIVFLCPSIRVCHLIRHASGYVFVRILLWDN